LREKRDRPSVTSGWQFHFDSNPIRIFYYRIWGNDDGGVGNAHGSQDAVCSIDSFLHVCAWYDDVTCRFVGRIVDDVSEHVQSSKFNTCKEQQEDDRQHDCELDGVHSTP